MPSQEEKLLAWRMFKCQCIIASAKAFQDLFWAVMKAKHGTAFETVAPQGRKGDGGNDGYLPDDKHYFQLYSPLNPKEKAGAAAKKLSADFDKLKKQWGGHGGRAVGAFTFVYNDKYEGIPKDIVTALGALRKKNAAIKLTPFGCADLEALFLSLPESEWVAILGAAVPDPHRITNLDYGVLAEVIRHIVGCPVADAETRLDLPPELSDKITLNHLSRPHAVRIEHGALLTGRIEHYFQSHSTFALSELRDHVVGIFEAAKAAVVATQQHAMPNTAPTDDVFVVFRRNLAPKNASISTANAIDAVIGYFFEACDVFDPKPTSKGKPGAST
jgi:hypothetical protein